MKGKPSVQLFFDNSQGVMELRESSKFFSCYYDEAFKSVDRIFFAKLRNEIRQREINGEEPLFLCGCCKGPLRISGGRMKCFHFKHAHSLAKGECIFYDGVKVSEKELNAMIYKGKKESREHKMLKSEISRWLDVEDNVEDVKIEEIVLKPDAHWRRPDIRAVFNNKTVVFEIQLSSINHEVILDRNEYYRSRGWYICWIFADINFDDPYIRQWDAWMTNNFNLFLFDEDAQRQTIHTGRLHFTVLYYIFTTDEDKEEIKVKWKKDTVRFSDLTFNPITHEVYLYDSGAEWENVNDEIKQARLDKELEQKRLKEDHEKQAEIERQERLAREEERQLELAKQQDLDSINNFLIEKAVDLPENIMDLMISYSEKLDIHLIYDVVDKLQRTLGNYDFNTLNKWLRVFSKIMRTKEVGDNIRLLTKEIWNKLLYHANTDKKYILGVNWVDYHDACATNYYRNIDVISLLGRPIDEESQKVIEDEIAEKVRNGNIALSDKQMSDYGALIMLSRYYHKKHFIPSKILDLLTNELVVRSLLAAQIGRPVATLYSNLKQVTNDIIQHGREYAHLFLYLLERNSRVDANISKLRIIVDTNSNLIDKRITFEEIDWMLPPKVSH